MMSMESRYQLYLGALSRHRTDNNRLGTECLKFCKMVSTYARNSRESKEYIDKGIDSFYNMGGIYNTVTKAQIDACAYLKSNA